MPDLLKLKRVCIWGHPMDDAISRRCRQCKKNRDAAFRSKVSSEETARKKREGIMNVRRRNSNDATYRATR